MSLYSKPADEFFLLVALGLLLFPFFPQQFDALDLFPLVKMVISGVKIELAALQFIDGFREAVNEKTVMRDNHDAAFKFQQIIFQPF